MMEKNRQTKVIAIVALVVAVVGMSLGFAAFSNILTISSSATVTPNKEDFKMKIWGFKDGTSVSNYDLEGPINYSLLSDVKGAFNYDSATNLTAKDAKIDNSALTIGDINVTFTTTSSDYGSYVFLIENVGEYDAYLDLSNMYNEGGNYLAGDFVKGTCTALEGTTDSLVQAACENIQLMYTIIDKSTGNGYMTTDSYYKIPKGDYAVLAVIVSYEGSALADGDFSVAFEDIKLNFSSTIN